MATLFEPFTVWPICTTGGFATHRLLSQPRLRRDPESNYPSCPGGAIASKSKSNLPSTYFFSIVNKCERANTLETLT